MTEPGAEPGAVAGARDSGDRSALDASPDARGDSGDVVDRRGYAAALTALGIGAALLLLAAGRVWATATTGGGGMPTVVVTLDGRAVAPVAAGAGLLLLAGIVGIVATRGVGRIVVGAILLLAALAATVSALQFGIGGPGTARSKVVESGETLQLTGSMWWLVALIGALLAAGAAVTTLLRGGRWPGMGSRYHRAATAATAPAAAGPSTLTTAQAWDALDRGEDPTTAAEVTE